MYKNKNKNKGVKVSLIVAFFAALLGCLIAFVCNPFGATKEASGEITAPEKSTTSAIAGGETADDGGIYAPELEAKATATTVYSGTTASAMQEAWTNAVSTSVNTGSQVTFVLQANWTAATDSTYVTSFGTGTGFSSGQLNIPAKANIVLDLNNHTIDRNLRSQTDGPTYGYAINIGSSSSVLEITDSSTNKNGKITGGKKKSDLFSVSCNGQLNFTGGTIDGGIYGSYRPVMLMSGGTITGGDSSLYGGGVNMNGGTFTMTGGTITSNKAKYGGGGVSVEGTFILSGGTISNNTLSSTSYNGGGVYVKTGGKFIMEKGSISFNSAPSGKGGGVSIDGGGTAIIKGGNINGNSSSYGGGIYVGVASYIGGAQYGACTMTGGDISSNTASSGAGVYVSSNTTFEMTDGNIYSNTASLNGGGVYVYGDFTMSGGTIGGTSSKKNTANGGGGVYVNGGTFAMTGGVITYNVGNSNGGGVYVYDGLFQVGGSVQITGNLKGTAANNVHLNTNKKINITGGIVGSKIGVTLASGVFTAGYSVSNSLAPSLVFTSDSGKEITLVNGEANVGTNAATTPSITLTWKYNTTGEGGTFSNLPANGEVPYTGSTYYVKAYNGSTVVTTSKISGVTLAGKTVSDVIFAGSYSYAVSTNPTSYTNPTFTLKIIPKDVTVTWENPTLRYTGAVQYPTATLNGLVSGDSTVKLVYDTSTAGTNAGSYSISISGLEGSKAVNYKFSSSATLLNNYTIGRAQISKPTASGELTYTGSSQSYNFVGFNSSLMSRSGYSGTNAGTYTATISLTDSNYEWTDGTAATLSLSWKINPASLASATVTLDTTSYTYDGSAKSPTVSSVKIGTKTISSSYYTITRTNNIDAGIGTVTVTGQTNYTGTAIATFTIDPKALTSSMVTLGTTSTPYTGSALTTTVTVKDGTTTLNTTNHYTVTYSNNTNAGAAVVMVTGKGNYAGLISKTFTITPKALTTPTITLGQTSYTYDGGAKTPSVSSVMDGSTAVTTYSVAYSNNINVSTSATVTLTFSGNYSGTVNKTFTITAANISTATVAFGVTNYTYTGSAISAAPTVTFNSKTLAQTVDYTVAYSNNTNAGSATVTVTGVGNYTGTATGNFTIDQRQIFVAGIKVADKAYDGNTSATVNMSGVRFIGAVTADLANLGLAFTPGSAFDGSSVGLHSVEVTGVSLTGTAAGNYILDVDEVTGYAQIYPATIKITGLSIQDGGKKYDGTLGGVVFDLSGLTLTAINGAIIEAEKESLIENLSINGAYVDKNVGTDGVVIYNYILGGEYAGNYVVDLEESQSTADAEITPAQVKVTLGKNEYVSTYGNALKITYSQDCDVKSESVTLALEYYDESNAKLDGVPTNAGNYLVKVVVDADDENAGNYVVITSGDGIISQATVTIEKATLTVTVEDLEIEYGSDVPENDDYTLIYSGWLNGDAAIVEPSVTVTANYIKDDDVGEYELTITVDSLANYNVVVADENGSLWVVAKSVTVRIDNKTSVYGATEVALTSNGIADMGITLEREDGTDVGKYIISGDWSNDNYDITFINGVYEITKATLTVTANDKNITYGDEAANDGVTYSGFVNGDDERVLIGTLAYRYTYMQYGNTGNYGIMPYGLSTKNYEIVYAAGILNVGKKAATVTVSNAASDITSVPADRADAAQKMKYVVDGTVNGDNLNVVLTIAGTNNEASLAWPAVGTYIVTGAAGNANYSVSFVYEDGATSGTYTITQGTLIITANTLILSYGESIAFSSDWEEAVTVEGLPEGATLTSLKADGVIDGSLTIGETTYTVGADIYDASGNRISYTVLPAGFTSTSYNIIYKPSKLMIEPKTITVTLDNKSSVYGEDDVALTASTTGLVNYNPAEDGSVVAFLGITGLTRVAGTDAGNYVITAESSTNKNYRVAFISGVYTITQYEVTVVWVSGNENANNFNYTYNGEAQAPVATFTMNDIEYRSDDASGYIEVTGSGTNVGDYKAQAFLLNPNLKFASDTDATKIFNISKRTLKVTWYASTDDIGDSSKEITSSTPATYTYKSGQRYVPVVVLDGIIDKDNSANFYYISGAQNAASTTAYTAEIHILNANYDVAAADKKVYFTIVKSTPNGFAWYEDTEFATEITELKKYTYNGEVQHPVAKSLNNEEFVYTIYKLTGDTEQKVISSIDVGSYKIEARPLNNNLQLSEAQTTFYFDIEAKVVTVTWSATSYEYNGAEQVPTAYYMDAQGQKVNLTVDGDKGVDADTYNISVTLNNTNYTFVVEGEQVQTVATTYEITAKNIQVTWKSDIDEDGSWTMVYNGTTVNADADHQALTATATMFNEIEKVGLKMTVMYRAKVSDTPVPADTIHDAGIYTLCVSLAEDSPNYNVVDATKTFTIEKKQLTVSAENKEVNTGSLAPTLTATYDGFADNESAESLELDATKWLTTNYNLNSPYITEDDYTQAGDITKLETLTDLIEGGYKGYFIVLTDSEARLNELNTKLHNYDWSFNYGRMIIIAVEGDVKIVLSHVYNGEAVTPEAQYKLGNNWTDLKVEVYTDETYTEKIANPEIKDAGDYYLLISKTEENGVKLSGADEDGEFEGCVKKTFTVLQRNVTVNVSDKTVVYGELTESNYLEQLASLWSYASNNKPLSGDELNITLSVDLNFDDAGYVTVLKDNGTVIGYSITCSWSEDATLRKNYNVIFTGSDEDKGELKVTEAEITFSAGETNGFNQIIETDKANGNYLLGLYSRKDGKYEYIDIVGNENASVKIYYSNIYDRSVYELTDNIPQKEPDAAWKETPLCSIPAATDGSFYVNFKIVVENHKAYYGQWTVQVIAGKAYIRIIFSDKQFDLTYGDATLNGTELASKLYKEGYVTCLDLTEEMFAENIENGNLTAKVLTDEIAVGSYSIVFEGIEKLNPDWIIIYKQDINANDDTATNIGKYVVTQRKLTISWDQTTFVYDGEAHFPKPSIEGWTRAEGTQTVNGATVYTFTNEELGKTLALTVRTNGGDFTTVGSENFVIAEIADSNYALDALNATRAVSITGPVGPVDPVEPEVKESGIPAWAVALLGVVAVLALLTIIILAVKSSKAKSAGDADGFYDDVDENS